MFALGGLGLRLLVPFHPAGTGVQVCAVLHWTTGGAGLASFVIMRLLWLLFLVSRRWFLRHLYAPSVAKNQELAPASQLIKAVCKP